MCAPATCALSLYPPNRDIITPSLQVITEANAHKIKAKVIAEGANGPITPAADEILIANKQLVIPDIYCNSGGCCS